MGNYANNGHEIRKKGSWKGKKIVWKEDGQRMEYKTSNVKVEIEISDMQMEAEREKKDLR